MELSNLEEHRQEAERTETPPPVTDAEPDPDQDPTQQRAEAQKEQSREGDSAGEPDARDGAATNPGGAGF